MFDKLKGVEKRFLEIEQTISDPKIVQDRERYQKYLREHAELSPIVELVREYRRIRKDLDESHELLRESEPDIRLMAREEIERLERERERMETELKKRLLPKDPNDAKNIILEIRAGTGGEEAGLFAGDLFRMYSRFAERRNWKVEILTQHVTGIGAIKEIVALIQGQGAYSLLKYESGIHRVQRVPETEAQGRIHTSAVTVAVLPEAEEVDVSIDPGDIRIDVYRSSGPGGQHVNTTDSAIRITHLPTGLVVTCQDEKSQFKNKAKAMTVLRARLYDKMVSEQDEKRSLERKLQVGSGDRSGRIRTYNFPQGRVTDHRIGLTLYRLESVLQGDLDEIIDALIAHYQTQMLQQNGTTTEQLFA
ncbi:peptide chain release factor 1 [Desulfatirhabdium butyrativorans]|uniref:peptide chain release factor 1 n=1 Tax=Desulfatirhabdium butyrativorans TaxID=340467 RepID=UPI00048A2E3A|nr:peptide chain release factor 1 [Desulfatirhabdium butyrativorans]